jgi:hypothetical protein
VGSLELVMVGHPFILRDDGFLDCPHFLIDSRQESSWKCKEANNRLTLL